MDKKEGNKIIQEFMGEHHLLWYHSDWRELMKVIERLVDTDLSEYMYQWEYKGEKRYNFQCINVSIDRFSCFIDIELDLDPPLSLSNNTECNSKRESVYVACVEAITNISRIMKNNKS